MIDKSKVVALWTRHGSTGANDKNLFRRPDEQLNEKGKKEAGELGKFLKPYNVGDVFTSGRDRTHETAKIAGFPKFTSLNELNAIDVGELIGKPKDDNRDLMLNRQEDTSKPFPGGESIDQFRKRTQPEIKRINAKGRPGKPVLTFAHNSVIHELSNVFTGDDKKLLVNPGGVVAVVRDGGEDRLVILFKGKAHKGMKLPKSAVDFEHPARNFGRGTHHCSGCEYFDRQAQRCQQISGIIHAGDWCPLYEPKSSKEPTASAARKLLSSEDQLISS